MRFLEKHADALLGETIISLNKGLPRRLCAVIFGVISLLLTVKTSDIWKVTPAQCQFSFENFTKHLYKTQNQAAIPHSFVFS